MVMTERGVMQVSVVVIGRNEGERLTRCLSSVRAARGGQAAELIYVDSASTDDSLQRARSLCDQVITVQPERPCAAIGRNAGWRQASGEFVLFLDGDTILHPDFIEHALLAMASRDIAAVWGHRREIDPGQSVWTGVMDLDWVYAPGETTYCGGDVLMRRSVLQQLNGFDETLIAGEEPELCRRIRAAGFCILHIDAPMTGHDLAIRQFSQYWTRAVRAGHAYAEIANRFRGSADPLWSDVVRGNARKGLFWSLWLLALCVSPLIQPVLLLPVLAVLALASVRTALKVRWKQRIAQCSSLRLLAYGVHSHLQHVPILWGQLRYRVGLWQGRQSRLMEYK